MKMRSSRQEKPMRQAIDVTGLAPEAIEAIESLVAVLRAQTNGTRHVATPSTKFPPKVERLLDTNFHAECEADTSPEVTLAEVRAGLSSIPGDMTADYVAEREDR